MSPTALAPSLRPRGTPNDPETDGVRPGLARRAVQSPPQLRGQPLPWGAMVFLPLLGRASSHRHVADPEVLPSSSLGDFAYQPDLQATGMHDSAGVQTDLGPNPDFSDLQVCDVGAVDSTL